MTRARLIPMLLLAVGVFIGLGCFFAMPKPEYAGRPVSAWVIDLASNDYTVRQAGLESVKAMGALAVPELMNALDATEPPFHTALQKLGRRLGRAWTWPDGPKMRAQAAVALSELGPQAAPALEALIDNLNDETPAVADEAERALIRLRTHSVNPLVNALADPAPEIRRRSLRALTEINPHHDQLLPRAISLAGDPDELVREQAVSSLASLRGQNDSRIHRLRESLSDSSERVKAAACDSLAQLGPAAKPAGAPLHACLRDASTLVRVRAARALWKISGRAEPSLEALIEGLNHPGIAFEAAHTLADMGPSAAPAVPALVSALKRERAPRPFRSAPSSAFALGKIGDAAIPALVEVLRDPNDSIRCSAALALGYMRADAKDAQDALYACLRDSSREVRHASVAALIHLDATGDDFITALEEMLSAEDIFLRTVAVNALRQIAPERDWHAQPE